MGRVPAAPAADITNVWRLASGAAAAGGHCWPASGHPPPGHSLPATPDRGSGGSGAQAARVWGLTRPAGRPGPPTLTPHTLSDFPRPLPCPLTPPAAPPGAAAGETPELPWPGARLYTHTVAYTRPLILALLSPHTGMEGGQRGEAHIRVTIRCGRNLASKESATVGPVQGLPRPPPFATRPFKTPYPVPSCYCNK
jgi:hypothetical protein